MVDRTLNLSPQDSCPLVIKSNTNLGDAKCERILQLKSKLLIN